MLCAKGVPNYFDDQRFGSVAGEGGEFIARLLVQGRFEDALRLALAAPYEYDRAAQKKEKRCWRHTGAIGRRLRTCCRAAMPAAWSITCASTPTISAVPSPACGRSCAACTCRRTRATCGTGCSRTGCARHLRPEQLRPVVPCDSARCRFISISTRSNSGVGLLAVAAALVPAEARRRRPARRDGAGGARGGRAGVAQMQIKGIREMFFCTRRTCRPVPAARN